LALTTGTGLDRRGVPTKGRTRTGGGGTPGLTRTVAPTGVVGCVGMGGGAATGLALGTAGGGAGGLAGRAVATAGKCTGGGALGGAVGGLITAVSAGALEAGTGGDSAGCTLGVEAGRTLSISVGAASAIGAPHCSQNSPAMSSGPLQKRQAIAPGGSGGFSNRSTASFSSFGSALAG
jgi:hypothetical protein